MLLLFGASVRGHTMKWDRGGCESEHRRRRHVDRRTGVENVASTRIEFASGPAPSENRDHAERTNRCQGGRRSMEQTSYVRSGRHSDDD